MDIRFRFGVIGFLAMIAAMVWLFPTWYPLIDRDSVPNPFPGLEDSAWEAFLGLPADQQAAYRALRDGNSKEDIDGRPAEALALVRARLLDTDTPAPEAEAAYDATDAELLKDGVFTQIDSIRWAQGRIAIYQINETRILRFESVSDEDGAPSFSTVRAPDLHVIFTRNPDPLDPAGVGGVGVDYLEVGPIKGTVGNQTYTVPESVNFDEYPVLVIYSESLDLVISTATLR